MLKLFDGLLAAYLIMLPLMTTLLTCGVQQGSIIGPLICIIIANNIYIHKNKSTC